MQFIVLILAESGDPNRALKEIDDDGLYYVALDYAAMELWQEARYFANRIMDTENRSKTLAAILSVWAEKNN